MSAPLTILERVRTGYPGGFSLRVESLALAEGECAAVLGRNGSGKSTLLRAMGLLRPPEDGVVRWKGEAVRSESQRKAARRAIGHLFQAPAVFRGTVLDNAALGLRLRGTPRAEARRRAEEWLDRLGVRALAGRDASTLSGGEEKRMALARILALQPALLLLDEPFSGLDRPSADSLLEALRDLAGREGRAAVVVSHDHRPLRALAGRAVLLVDGAVAADGAWDTLDATCADPEARILLGFSELGTRN